MVKISAYSLVCSLYCAHEAHKLNDFAFIDGKVDDERNRNTNRKKEHKYEEEEEEVEVGQRVEKKAESRTKTNVSGRIERKCKQKTQTVIFVYNVLATHIDLPGQKTGSHFKDVSELNCSTSFRKCEYSVFCFAYYIICRIVHCYVGCRIFT